MAKTDKLTSTLKKINWLFESIQDGGFDKVSALEKSLLKEKVLMFYHQIDSLNTEEPIVGEIPTLSKKEEIENDIIVETIESKKESVKMETIVEESVVEKIVVPEVVIEAPIVEKPILKDIITTPVVVEEMKQIVVEQTIVEPVVEKVIQENVFEEVKEMPKVVAPEVINPEISKKEKFEKTEEYQRQIAMPKRDMREIIDLNKSFIFKAELFSQNNNLYNEFINEMNTTRNENDSLAVLINWTEKLNWETEENKAYDLLIRSVEKRFLPLI